MDGFLDLQRQFQRDLTCKEHNSNDILPVGQDGSTLIKKLQNKDSGTSISSSNQNYPECNLGIKASKSTSNKMAHAPLAVSVTGKI